MGAGTACTGGTFDPFHAGHEALLERAFEVADEVIVGLTTDEFVEKAKDRDVAPYDERADRLRKFAHDRDERLVVVPLYEEFGPAPFVHDAEVIVVSEETQKNAERINDLRRKWGRDPLEIVTVPLQEAEDGKPISGTRVAAGEISPEGSEL